MIRLSEAEKRYARALSLRIGGCRNPDAGSVSYALKALLHERAVRDGISIGDIYEEKIKKTETERKEKIKEWRNSDKGKESARKASKNHWKNNPEQAAAQGMLRYKVWTGEIKKPEKCSFCGIQNVRVCGHHHMGYSKENWYNVVWLCDDCHRKEHKK
jgi:hypothetical protein